MRVLVIENNINDAKSLQKGLEAEFYAVDFTIDTKDGLRMAETGDYDLITINQYRSNYSSIKFVKTLRNHDLDTSIIVITENRETKSMVNLLDVGCDDYLVKPFHFEELAARIRAIFRRRRASISGKIKCGPLELDPTAHEVLYKDENIDLRNREFDLLEYLMKNSGRVVTRNMVLEHVWDINADSFSNTVEVHVTHLRRKLGEGSSMIKTIRGVGYKLMVEK